MRRYIQAMAKADIEIRTRRSREEHGADALAPDSPSSAICPEYPRQAVAADDRRERAQYMTRRHQYVTTLPNLVAEAAPRNAVATSS